MLRVKRRTPREEMSPFLCFPKTAWMTSQSLKRLSWTLTDLGKFKNNGYHIGVRKEITIALPVKMEEPEVEEVEDDLDAIEGWPEAIQRSLEVTRQQRERYRYYTRLIVDLIRSHGVIGMTSQDLARIF